jgi:hypothetical protein
MLLNNTRYLNPKCQSRFCSFGVPSMLAIMLLAMALPHAVSARSPFDGDPINYSTAKLNDPISQLQERIDSGQLQLKFDKEFGYLKSLLKVLKVPASSQGLVFSKTSFQRPRISPSTPRAIYFSDNAYIGWVQGGDVLEISSVDPQLGAIFYSLDQEKTDRPIFERRFESCMICHSSSLGQRVPGHLVQSIYPRYDGRPIKGTPRLRVDHTSPFAQRWGGWYVTGTHGKQRHLGNLIIDDQNQLDNLNLNKLNLENGANLTSLADRFDTKPYLLPHSDMVALLVLEHQAQMHNALTAANFEARRALHDEAQARKIVIGKETKLSPVTELRLSKTADALVKWMLFADEAKFSGPIKGTSGFAQGFSRNAPRDSAGRSLRDFDLKTRLFKYPCSYLINSLSFDQLPGPLLDRVYMRLWQVLIGKEKTLAHRNLSVADRTAIRTILIATRKDLPAYWVNP